MTRTFSKFVASVTLAVSIFFCTTETRADRKPSPAFDSLVDDFFDFYFKYRPNDGTAAGFHQYDSESQDFSAPSREAEIGGLNDFLVKLHAVTGRKKPKLSEVQEGDLQVLDGAIRARLLELETIQMWRKDPDVYTTDITYGIFILIKRNFAPPEARMQSVIARERRIPQCLEQARKNLSNPPRVYTEVALEQLPGTIGFFKDDVPKAFAEVKDAKLLAEFRATNQASVEALQKYEDFLRNDLLPVSNGDFRIGAENFRKKLLYEEMVDIPLDRLTEIGYADLRRNQQRLIQVAAQIDPKRPPREVLDDLHKDHPPANQLLQYFRHVTDDLRSYIEEKKIITIPSKVPPIIEETPAFQRALTTAAMETPGAYESKATEAMFLVTLPEPTWKPEQVEEWMEGFNRGTIVSTAVHEAYPGHYTQFLWVPQAPSKTRKLLYCSTNAEGWAHYTEQMMLDEGYGGGDLNLRLGQIIDALLRDARYIAGIEMHTGNMTLEQARQFFINEGYQVAPMADVESKRGTSDPTYLVYTLGKLQIMKLREDYHKKKGRKFTLQDFHDEFMRQGAIPIKIIRKTMLEDDSPAL